MIAIAKDGQCLVDVALMTTGAVEGVWAIALRNGLSVTGEIGHGTEVLWESEDVEDAGVAARYATEGISPATEVSARLLEELLNAPRTPELPSYALIEADEVVPELTRAAVFGVEFTAAFA